VIQHYENKNYWKESQRVHQKPLGDSMRVPALLAIMELFSVSMIENSLQAAPNYTSHVACEY